MKKLYTCLITVVVNLTTYCQDLLPRQRHWQGQSEALIVNAKNSWITPAESSGFREMPSYSDTRKWLERLAASSPLLKLSVIGKSAGDRDSCL